MCMISVEMLYKIPIATTYKRMPLPCTAAQNIDAKLLFMKALIFCVVLWSTIVLVVVSAI